MRFSRGKRIFGQTAVEYMLAISVVVTSVYAAFYLLRGPEPDSGPAQKSFDNVRKTIERPYP